MGKQLETQLRGYKNHPESMLKDPTFPIFEVGVEWGMDKVRKEVLDYLQYRYIDAPDRPNRGSPEAKALLSLTNDLSKYIAGLIKDGI